MRQNNNTLFVERASTKTQSEQLAARQHALVLRCEDVLWKLGITKEEVMDMAKKYLIDPKKLKASEGK